MNIIVCKVSIELLSEGRKYDDEGRDLKWLA